MKLGMRLQVDRTLTDENLSYLKQLGVDHVIVGVGTAAGYPERQPIRSPLRRGDCWEAGDLRELKTRLGRFGLELFGLSHTPFHRFEKVIRGLPGRDEQIEHWCRSLRHLGQVGIGLLQYNWVIGAGARFSNWRTSETTPGRGGALLSSFDYEQVKDAPLTAFGRIGERECGTTWPIFCGR